MQQPQVDRSGSDSTRTVLVVRVVVALLAVVALLTPVLLTRSSWREDVLFNGDEAVAALLPVEFERGAPVLLFPDNAYQGVLEVPAYAVLWRLTGADPVPMRVLHQAIWLAAIGMWFAAALHPARRSGRIGAGAWWWAALVVTGTLAITSVVGWPVWFRIYPGYHLGAALAGAGALLAVHTADRPERSWARWWLAGLAAGLAVYAQPMHVAGLAVVGAVALAAGRSGWFGRLVSVGTGVVVGLAPLVLWNVRNEWATLDRRRQPVVEHPEWGYLDRFVGLWRTTQRVLWGGDQLDPGRVATVAAVVVAATLVLLCVIGLVVLVRNGGVGAALVVGPLVMLAGLPVLEVMSLQVDPRYAVGWWPALVVLLAAGAAWAAQRRAGWGRAARAGLALVVLVHLGTVVAGARAVERTTDADLDTVGDTAELTRDLRRCGVDTVWGSYWRVYPVLWASEAQLRGRVQWGPQRLDELAPADPDTVRRVAVLPPPDATDAVAAAEQLADGTGRGASGWLALVHPDSGVALAVELTGEALPEGCVGPGGLEPLTQG